MLWFRLGVAIGLCCLMLWATGLVAGICSMFSDGASTRILVEDPSRNGTYLLYGFIVVVQVYMLSFAIFGSVVAFKVWGNNFQIDSKLRRWYVIWLGGWGMGTLCMLTVSIYTMVKGKDQQENMAVLYDSFQRYYIETKFVSALEKYQKEQQCCGIFGADDWLVVHLRQAPIGSGAAVFQNLDFGYKQNPGAGKCHMVPPVVPPGCGTQMIQDIVSKLKLYAMAVVGEVILAIATAVMSWYSFFYWLEKEVIVIPEDEVSNIIIIEPESRSSISGENMRSSRYYENRYRMSSAASVSETNIQHSRPPRFSDFRARNTRYQPGSGNLMNNQRGSFMNPDEMDNESGYSFGRYHVTRRRQTSRIRLTPSQILREQQQALGGRVLAEMHVNRGSTNTLRPSNGKRKATVAVMRHKNNSPNRAKGSVQTGNLAKGIVEMSGTDAKRLVHDVVIPVERPGVVGQVIEVPIGAHLHRSSMPGVASSTDREEGKNLIEKALQAQKKKTPSIYIDKRGTITVDTQRGHREYYHTDPQNRRNTSGGAEIPIQNENRRNTFDQAGPSHGQNRRNTFANRVIIPAGTSPHTDRRPTIFETRPRVSTVFHGRHQQRNEDPRQERPSFSSDRRPTSPNAHDGRRATMDRTRNPRNTSEVVTRDSRPNSRSNRTTEVLYSNNSFDSN